MRSILVRSLCVLLLSASLAQARVHEAHLHASFLRSLDNSPLLTALDKALDGACRIQVTDGELIVSLDPQKLPRTADQARRSARVFTELAAPEAAADQRALMGLHLPRTIDPDRPMTILIHGLDGDPSNFNDLVPLLQQQTNQQIACFAYPSDQPIADSAALFHEHLAAVHETFPNLKLNIIAHSMGSLVARQVIEGPDYPGGVDHLILIAPPNHGSKWAPFRLILEAQEHYRLWRTQPKWRPTWLITDGLGEAGRDLHPDSKFLSALNALPRREGVRYTIVAGQRSLAMTAFANVMDHAASIIPSREPYLYRAHASLERFAGHLRNKPSKSDGPVTLASASLQGVSDFVALPADHCTLCCGVGQSPPAAWPVILHRLQH